MLRLKFAAALGVASVFAAAAPAHADGLGGEANYAHAEGRDGVELGAGYSLGLAGFSLTPGGGLYVRNGETKAYARAEAAFTVPGSVTVGVGVRIAEDARPYGTVAFPILPKVAIKGNVGDHYLAIGVKVGY
jgi:hypothetical protein